MMLKPTIFISCFLFLGSAQAFDSQLNIDRNSGKIEYKLSKSLPKGDYKIWNLTKDTDVGIEINKKSPSEVSGKTAIANNSFDDKFALLDPDGLVVYTMETETAPRTPSATAATTVTATPPPIPPMIVAEARPPETDKKILPEISAGPTTLSEEIPLETEAPAVMIDTD